MKKILKWGLLIVIAFTIFIAGGRIGSYGNAVINGYPPPTSFVKPLEQDPQLVEVANQLGLDISHVNLRYNPELKANGEDAIGVFTWPNTIEIKPGLGNEEKVTIAHEYLHFVWANQSNAEREAGTKLYLDYYNQSAWMQRRLSEYQNCNDECMASEVHSYACTEIRPYRLTDEFNRYCNSHIPGRYLLFN